MAINDKDQVQAEVAQPQVMSAARQAAPQQDQPWSFHTAGLFGSPIPRSRGSEYLNKLVAKLSESYKNANQALEISLITLDNNNYTALAFSAVVVAVKHKEAKDKRVAYHILLVEATGDKVAPIFEQNNNVQIEITRVTGDALDEVLVKLASDEVAKAYPQHTAYLVDGCVVPSSFNVENDTHVHNLALNAGWACGTTIEMTTTNFGDLNLAMLAQDSNLVVNVAFNRNQVENAVGEPERSDVLIAFSSQKQNQNQRNQGINSGDREAKIAELSGFVDVVWAPVAQPSGLGMWQTQAQQLTQKYAARLVLTSMVSNYSATPASILLDLVTSVGLATDNNWVQAFRPVNMGNSNEIDLRDIGALNIEANITNEANGVGTRIDTKSDTFTMHDLGQLIQTLIQPGLIMSLDVPECGPQTWYLSQFAAAASNNANATQQVLRAANELTNGAFGKYFPANAPIFTDTGNRVHLGTWVDRNGTRRDIRDIDYLAVANLVGDRSPVTIRDWSDTFTRTQYPLVQRLAARKKIIQGLTNETAEFTGYAQRVTFTAQFIDALTKGCTEAGLIVRVNTPLTGSDFNNQRGVAGFVGHALIGATGHGFTVAPQGYSPQYNSNAGSFGHRF